MKRFHVLWPATLLLSALAAGLVYFVFPDVPVRPLVVMWFLFVCPGMAVIRLLRLREAIVEWTLAIALSFALDAIIAGIQLYAKVWSPSGTIAVLIVLCLGGAVAQMVPERRSHRVRTNENHQGLRSHSSADLDRSGVPSEPPSS